MQSDIDSSEADQSLKNLLMSGEYRPNKKDYAAGQSMQTIKE